MSETSKLFDAQYLDAMLNALSDMVRVVTREGKVAYTNKAYDRKMTFGQNTVGSFCHELYGNQDPCTPCISSQVVETGKMRQVTRHLNNRTYTVTVSPLRNEATGEIMGTVEVFRDITLDFNIRTNVVAQNIKLRHELHMAQCVQEALVRNVLPDVEGYRLYAGYFPCEAVGGDIYDCILMGDRMVMYAADACGHGVMPAMLSVFFSRAVRTACMLGYDTPAGILTYVQGEFLNLELPDEIYITGFAIVLDLPTGDFTYTNAGLSVEPIVCHDGQIEELCMYSPPIARWMPRREYVSKNGHLDPSDRLLIYTDGISELQTSEEALHHMYGMFSDPEFDAENFIRLVRREIVSKSDDMTLLVCVRAPKTEGA